MKVQVSPADSLLSSPAVDLASVCTPEMMAPILSNPEVQQRLLEFLPSGESLPQSADEIQNTLSSPQFQQVGQDHHIPSQGSLSHFEAFND